MVNYLHLYLVIKILKLKNHCHIVVSGWQKSMCLAAAGAVAMASCQTLACALDITVLHGNLKPNGPAIWGGCVTRRSNRSRSRYFSQKAVTVQGGYGVVFANPGTSFIEAGRVAVQVLSEPVNCHGTKCFLGALAQCRGTSLIGARNLSRCRIYVAYRCGRPDASFSRICHGSWVPQKP